ncbi:MAG: hypothetical protein P8J00_13030 [Yoonia sp.]|nr:hypothetical protein [Yoonia sp.]
MIVLPPRIPPPKRSLRVETMEGLTWLWTRPVLRRLALSLGVINGLHMLAMVVLVLVSQERLGLSASGFGVLLAMGAAGSVVGGFIYPAIVRRIGAQRSRTLSLALFPAPFLIIGLANNVILVGTMLCFKSLVSVLWNVVTVSYRQRVIPHELLGGWTAFTASLVGGPFRLGPYSAAASWPWQSPHWAATPHLRCRSSSRQLAPDCCAYGA